MIYAMDLHLLLDYYVMILGQEIFHLIYTRKNYHNRHPM